VKGEGEGRRRRAGMMRAAFVMRVACERRALCTTAAQPSVGRGPKQRQFRQSPRPAQPPPCSAAVERYPGKMGSGWTSIQCMRVVPADRRGRGSLGARTRRPSLRATPSPTAADQPLPTHALRPPLSPGGASRANPSVRERVRDRVPRDVGWARDASRRASRSSAIGPLQDAAHPPELMREAFQVATARADDLVLLSC